MITSHNHTKESDYQVVEVCHFYRKIPQFTMINNDNSILWLTMVNYVLLMDPRVNTIKKLQKYCTCSHQRDNREKYALNNLKSLFQIWNYQGCYNLVDKFLSAS